MAGGEGGAGDGDEGGEKNGEGDSGRGVVVRNGIPPAHVLCMRLCATRR